jgi:hypothetical protein
MFALHAVLETAVQKLREDWFHGMDFRELLSLIVEHPFFLTDNYSVQIRHAIRARYAELTCRDSRVLLVLERYAKHLLARKE